ncbi:MAG: phosphoribosyl-AMP cyclohydrolase [Thermomicrobiales bacterium]|nr:phosphoribosyl-AMP cyclohydrolase [Thermomicrobiales bacterium]
MTHPLAIDFEKHPLVPAVIVDHRSGEVLMIAFMNEEAYRKTRETGRTHFWSRSRNKLWRKGETSGHEQIVQKMSINCEDNALLIAVEQLGAVCHTGHPTCFYRDIEADESLTVTTDRLFDPDVVYGGAPDPTRLWFGAFAFLKAQPLEEVSSSSRLLKVGGAGLGRRVADELGELAGVLDGTHRHKGLPDDLFTEGSQALYWLAMVAVSHDITWDDLRPDRALATYESGVSPATASQIIRAASSTWRDLSTPNMALIHETMGLVAQAAASTGIAPTDLIDHDLTEMRTRSYLEPYFLSR